MVSLLTMSMTFGLVLPSFSAYAAESKQETSNYVGNKGELLKTPFIQLPLGAVKARDWLENQLLLQKDNITGNMHLYNDYNKETSQWLGAKTGDDWERGPYFLRGLVALAYTLDDEGLKAEAQEWIDWSINSQKENGFFGPPNDSWWARMPVLMAIRDYYEVTEAQGNPDERVLPFMEKYFRYQASELPKRPLSNWADARGGDNIDSVYWFYNRVYDEKNPDESKWLLDLGTLLLEQTTDWTNEYNNTTVRQHVVNTSQGMKTPPVYYQFDQSEKYKTALANGIFNMGIDHGRVDGLPNSDEAARDNRGTRGSETCGIVEGLLSTEIAQKVFGEAWIGDKIEEMAYNSLPPTTTPDFSGHTYYVLQNQVLATLGNHEFDCDHGDSSAFGAPLGFDCCYSNVHMGWPKFVQNMWMATANKGLAIVAYGPNSVTAKVADGKTAKFVQNTDYPFKENVELIYDGEEALFELQLRIPEWAKAPTVVINGEKQSGVENDSYYKVTRNFKKGDVIKLTFPSEIETTTWYNDSTAVQKGPLVFGLKIDEDWRTYDSNDMRELKVEHQPQSPLREIYPASPWNYGLVVDENDPTKSFKVETVDDVALQPFSIDNAPITLKAKGQRIPEWTLDGNLAGPQPFGPTKYDASMVEDIELIPYASGRLRISQFPSIGDAKETVIRTTVNDGKEMEENGKKYLEFDNIIVPMADNYKLTINGSGSGKVIINGKYEQDIDLASGSMDVESLKEKLSGFFKFDAKQYNNIRFTGAKVDSIEVTPIKREITEVTAYADRTVDRIRVSTNLDAQETPYRVLYGTEPSVYTNTVRGFESDIAILTGLDADQTYYVKVVASIMGVDKSSPEITVAPSTDTGGLKPNPNAPDATYTGFNSLNYMETNWKTYSPDNKVKIQNNSGGADTEIRIEKSERAKAALVIDGADKWTDLVVETELTLDDADNNSCGVMHRSTGIGDNPDEYNGYFVGIGHLNVNNLPETNSPYEGPGIMIGYADGQWHDLKPIKKEIQPNQKYKLKVVAYGNRFAVYLDDEFITTFENDKYIKGTVGVRSYNEEFTAHNVVVRNVTEDDLKVFEDGNTETPPEYVKADFVDDFSDKDTSVNNWTKVGKTDLIVVTGGAITVGKSQDVKVTAGDERWTDFVYKANISLKEGEGGNAGILFRSTKEGSGADNYEGYYFGISDKKFEVGKSSKEKWTEMTMGDGEFGFDQIHELKVVVYQNRMAFYVDGEKVYSCIDDTHKLGKIGLRGYNRGFEVNRVEVSEPTQEDIDSLTDINPIELSAVSAYNIIQLTYSKPVAAQFYKILYGTQPGVYTDEFVDIHPNGYKGGNIFKSDKTAFSTKTPGTYYVKMQAINGSVIVSESNEIQVTTGNRESTSGNINNLTSDLTKIESVDTKDFTQTSLLRLRESVAYANTMLKNPLSSQMDLDLAGKLLISSSLKKDSDDWQSVIPKPDPNPGDEGGSSPDAGTTEEKPKEEDKPQDTDKDTDKNTETNDGWKTIAGEKYFYKDGKIVTVKWITTKAGNKYFVGEDGAMVASRWVTTKAGNKYYVLSTGRMATSRWITTKAGNKYYVDANGRMATSKWITTKVGNKYYVDAKGRMATSKWITTKAGNKYYVTKTGKMLKTYYYNAAGKKVNMN